MSDRRVSCVVSGLGKTIVGRLLPGTDLIEGILRVCEEGGISFGSIDVVLGSLRRFTFVYPIRDESQRMGVKYCDPVVIDGPIELLCGSGLVGINEGGERVVHLHVVVSDGEGKVHGGHVVSGNPVLVTVEIVIRELNGVNIIRGYDEDTGFYLFKFQR